MRRQRAGYPFDNQVLAKQRLTGMVHAKDSGVAERGCAYSVLMQTKDFVDVAARAHDLRCRVPVRVALLPGNFATAADAGAFCYHAATPHVRSAWQSVGLEDEGPQARSLVEPGHDKDAGLAAQSTQVPLAVFFGASLLTGPEWCLTVALSMVSRVFALHPICASPREVRLDVVVERQSGGFACLEYHGDAYGLVALAREVRGIWQAVRGNQSGREAVCPRRRSMATGHVYSVETKEARKCESLGKGGGDA